MIKADRPELTIRGADWSGQRYLNKQVESFNLKVEKKQIVAIPIIRNLFRVRSNFKQAEDLSLEDRKAAGHVELGMTAEGWCERKRIQEIPARDRYMYLDVRGRQRCDGLDDWLPFRALSQISI